MDGPDTIENHIWAILIKGLMKPPKKAGRLSSNQHTLDKATQHVLDIDFWGLALKTRKEQSFFDLLFQVAIKILLPHQTFQIWCL